MEETYQITSALKFLKFGKHVAVITDARFSGVSTGACIGHVGPEALAGGPIARLRDGLAAWGLVTETVLWVGVATSMIYVVSGFAQYALGRRIIDRYPLKNTYVIASGLQVVAIT